MQISASKLRTYATCPKQYDYKYIQKLPELERDYFETGKRVEDQLYCMLSLTTCTQELSKDEMSMATALYNFKPFRKLIEGKKLVFQKEYDTPMYKAFTDIETDECVIDIKTSSTDWNEEMVQESKWQAKIYTKLTGKPFYFCIVNKKTKKCQLIKVPVTDFEDLHLKIDELQLAVELGVFQPTPSFKCRFCSFKETCDKDRGFTR